MQQVAAVILAGGKGERLGGVVKAGLRVGGITLLDRVSAVLGPQASPQLVACGGFEPARLGLHPHQIAIPDLACPYAGPIAGVGAAAEWLQRSSEPPDYLLSIAVDTPFAPPDLIDRLLSALANGGDAAVAGYGGQDYPTNALWRLAALRALPTSMAAGTAPRSLRRLARELAALSCDWPSGPGGDPFVSVNTPAELSAAEARATLV